MSEVEYFRALEAELSRLRGAPVILPPADYHQARAWREMGIPLDVVTTAMGEVYARRRESGELGRVSSLRYFASEVARAWAAIREVTAVGDRTEAPALDVSVLLVQIGCDVDRLLPSEGRGAHVRSLAALVDPEEIERRLIAIDREVVDVLWARMALGDRDEIRQRVDGGIARVSTRGVSADALGRVRESLRRENVRQRYGFAPLSLFFVRVAG